MSRMPLFLVTALLFAVVGLPAQDALAADPAGTATGGIEAVPAAIPGSPTLQEVGAALGQTRVSLNFVWIMLCAFLVMLMQAGFALAETGFTRAKNAAHTMTMNFMVYAIGILGYWAVGYALQMGGAGAAPGGVVAPPADMGSLIGPTLGDTVMGLFGGTGFFLSGGAYDVSAFAMFLFHMVFMDTALTIPTGSMAERWKLKAFVIYGFAASMVIYPVFANWAWGGGWLSKLGSVGGMGHGYVDFAGSGVVHLTGGVMALVGAKVLGPRIGKFVKGRPQAIPGHNLPMGVLGAFILAFGWFGFNAGSTLAGTDLRLAVVATNTMLASAGGALAAYLLTWKTWGKPDASMSVNGMLAGLVAITAPCAFVTAPVAVGIGAAGGLLAVGATLLLEHKLGIDDPVGAIPVHLVNGVWGLLALGLFADGTYGAGLNGIEGGVRGLFYGDTSQLLAQVTGIGANLLWVGGTSVVLFKVLDATVGMRVPADQELEGLDFHEVTMPAYPEGRLDGAPASEPAMAGKE